MQAGEDAIHRIRRVVRTRGVRGVWHAVRSRIEPYVTAQQRATAVLATQLRHGSPDAVVSFLGGIGDDVMCTILCRELRRRGVGPVWMMSRYPDLFEHNDDVALVRPWDRSYWPAMRERGWKVLNARYFRLDVEAQRSILVSPEQHIVTTMCRVIGIVGPIERKPTVVLTEAELAAGSRVPRQVAIQSSGLAAATAMMNKEWFPARFQEVVTALRGEVDFVQVGSAKDPLLDGVLDLRGRTSRRETAALLARSLCFIGNTGFLMHLARAVDCRSVIVYGGRERPAQTGYGCNENLAAEVPCAPCWYRNRCDHDRLCMRLITSADVVAAVRRTIAKQGLPLEVDTDVIEPERLEPASPGRRPMMTVTTPFGDRRLEALLPPPDAPRSAATMATAGR